MGSILRAAVARSAPAGIAATGGNASGNSADESRSERSAVKRQPDNTRIQRAMGAGILWKELHRWCSTFSASNLAGIGR